MVEDGESVSFVTEQRLRDRSAAQARRVRRLAAGDAAPARPAVGTLAVPPPVPAVPPPAAAPVASALQPPPEPTPPPDPSAAFRHGRLAVTVALVLFLYLLWLRQRRSARNA